MFNLEQSINDWRRQMLVAGIKSPAHLDELESHLRDDVQAKLRSGLAGPEAFASAVRQMGGAQVLQNEFFKTRVTMGRRLKRLIFIFADVPNFQLVTNRNIIHPAPKPNVELRWATYLKAAAFALPSALIWMFSMVFITPRLQQLCQSVGWTLFTFKDAPAVFQAFALVGRGLFLLTQDGLFVSGVMLLALILLESYSSQWPRYRRAVLGAGTFLLNLAVLIAITLMVVTALVVVPSLHHVK